MNLKRKIIIVPEKRKNKGVLISENAPLRFRISVNGQRVEIFSGFRINLKDWDYQKSKMIDNSRSSSGQSANEINIALANYESDLNKFFLKCVSDDYVPTINEVKEEFRRILETYNPERIKKAEPEHTEDKPSFFEVMEIFFSNTGRENSWTINTHKKFNALRNHLYSFNPKLEFDDLTHEGLGDILSYFIKELKLKNSTTKKYYKFILYFLRYALNNNYTDNEAFKTYKPKLKKASKKIIFLTEEEILKIKETKLPPTKNYLERVRDVLLFLCYSGLRYSDVYKLKRSDIKNGKFEVTTQKTNDSLIIELNSTTKEILDKYKDIPFNEDKALPVISNQRMNEYLKELGELAEIDEAVNETYFIGNKRHDISKPKYEHMSTHIGRRSFICLCIAKGIPVQVIMKWTGHSDYKSMKPYIDISGKTKEIEMQKLNF